MAGYVLRTVEDATAEWAVEAVTPDGAVAGRASLRSWTEDDGVRVCLTQGEVRPSDRRRGLGGRLLDATEAAAARLAGIREQTGPLMLGGNADEGQDDRMALLASRGYRRVLTMITMRHDGSPVPVRPLPEGIAVRTATVEDAAALRRLAERAWAGRPFTRLPPEDRLRDWLRRSDLSTFRVAVAGEQAAGFVAVTGDEIEDVAVDPAFQRRGLASALLSQALDRLGGPARLRTEAHDPAGARTLYEGLGFRLTARHHRCRKPLR